MLSTTDRKLLMPHGNPQPGDTWISPGNRTLERIVAVSDGKVWANPVTGGEGRLVPVAEVQNDWLYVNPDDGADPFNVTLLANGLITVDCDKMAGGLTKVQACALAANLLNLADDEAMSGFQSAWAAVKAR